VPTAAEVGHLAGERYQIGEGLVGTPSQIIEQLQPFVTIVGDFGRDDRAAPLPWSTAARVWTKSEGSPSADGRYWGFQVETSNFEPLGLMVWDRHTDAILGTWDFAEHGAG
jgi:hypothetical protein